MLERGELNCVDSFAILTMTLLDWISHTSPPPVPSDWWVPRNRSDISLRVDRTAANLKRMT